MMPQMEGSGEFSKHWFSALSCSRQQIHPYDAFLPSLQYPCFCLLSILQSQIPIEGFEIYSQKFNSIHRQLITLKQNNNMNKQGKVQDPTNGGGGAFIQTLLQVYNKVKK